jgi:hypothetical protein
LSPWLELMLAEMARKRAEFDNAQDEEARRRSETAAASSDTQVRERPQGLTKR